MPSGLQKELFIRARYDWQRRGNVTIRAPLFHRAFVQSVKVGGGPEKRNHISRTTNVPETASGSLLNQVRKQLVALDGAVARTLTVQLQPDCR